MNESGFSRFPVTGEGVDDVLGVLLAKELLPCVPRYLCEKNDFKVMDIMRDVYFIPGTKPINELLNEFKRRKLHMAILLDEHGGVDGVVTLEDLLEEIVGDIFDESDTPSSDVVEEDNGDVLVDGGVLVSDLNELLGFEIPEGDYDTVGGFVFSSLGRVPEEGDLISIYDSGFVLVNGENGAAHALGDSLEDGVESSADDSLDDGRGQIRLDLSVECMENHRVEKIRLRTFASLDGASETPPASDASQPHEKLKDKAC